MYAYCLTGFLSLSVPVESLCVVVLFKVTMSYVSTIQCLDLCVAYNCIAVTPLYIPVTVSQ